MPGHTPRCGVGAVCGRIPAGRQLISGSSPARPQRPPEHCEDELELEIYQFTKVLKTVGCDLKFLSMRFPLSLERQKAVLLHHARQAGDETRIRWLERQIRELEVAETNISSQHFYLAYWGKDADTLRKNHDMIRKYAATGYQPLVRR